MSYTKDFAIQHYFIRFKYIGIDYYIVYWEECCARTDETWNNVIEKYSNAISLIEQLEIDGVKLIDFMNDIEEVEVF